MCDQKRSPPASTYAASPLSPLLRGCGSKSPPPTPPSPAPPGAARTAPPGPGAGDPQTWFLTRTTVNTARLLEHNRTFYQRFPSKPESVRVTCKHKPFFGWVGAGRRRNGIRPSFPFLGAEMRSGETNTWRISLPFAYRARKLGFLFNSLTFGFFCEKSFFECGMAWGQRTKLLAGGARKAKKMFNAVFSRFYHKSIYS